MLKINTKFYDGIMFIRLDGILSKKEVYKFKKEVTNIIRENKIRKVVFNLANLNYIDKYGINSILQSNINNNNLICNTTKELSNKFRKYNFKIAENELEALRLC
ncbi:MAG: STAS domain-containing protein [Bacillales bacterium]|nr:STAS domain-containing protein [Bacillales bacterium]